MRKTSIAIMAGAVREAANRVLPSVVAIEIIGTSGAAQGEVEQDAPTSGIILDADGYVLASSIVVARPSASILVVLPDGTRQAAKVVARDHHRDLVLLKIETDKVLDGHRAGLDGGTQDRPNERSRSDVTAPTLRRWSAAGC